MDFVGAGLRTNRFQYNLLNGHKSTREPYGKEEKQNVFKCFLLRRLQMQSEFFSHSNPYTILFRKFLNSAAGHNSRSLAVRP